MIDREAVYNKFGGRCAYTGTKLKDDWQIDHIIPRCKGGTDDIENLLPTQKIVNHYKRALDIESFRTWYLGGLHERLKKLPKHPRVARSLKRKNYMLEIAELFGIEPDKPFCGVFYFERMEAGE